MNCSSSADFFAAGIHACSLTVRRSIPAAMSTSAVGKEKDGAMNKIDAGRAFHAAGFGHGAAAGERGRRPVFVLRCMPGAEAFRFSLPRSFPDGRCCIGHIASCSVSLEQEKQERIFRHLKEAVFVSLRGSGLRPVCLRKKYDIAVRSAAEDFAFLRPLAEMSAAGTDADYPGRECGSSVRQVFRRQISLSFSAFECAGPLRFRAEPFCRGIFFVPGRGLLLPGKEGTPCTGMKKSSAAG